MVKLLSFVLFIMFLVRYVFFAIVWIVTWGRHHFWLLPNLTEECGFFESFVPLYTHECKGHKAEDKQEDNENEKGDKTVEEKEKDDGSKDDSSEDKDQTEKEPWVNLTEEEVATAKSEVDKVLEESNDPLSSEVKC